MVGCRCNSAKAVGISFNTHANRFCKNDFVLDGKNRATGNQDGFSRSSNSVIRVCFVSSESKLYNLPIKFSNITTSRLLLRVIKTA